MIRTLRVSMVKSRYHLEEQAKLGFRGYLIATVAFYGPTADFASKVVVAIVPARDSEPDVLERFFSKSTDVRFDENVGNQVLTLIRTQAARTAVMADRIIGCPHEEGIDYPEGTNCPQCPFWPRVEIVFPESAFNRGREARKHGIRSAVSVCMDG